MDEREGADKNEVTEEMAKVGANLIANWFDCPRDSFMTDLAKQVYLEMREARPQSA